MCLQLYNCMRYFLPLALLDKNTKYQLKKFFEWLSASFSVSLEQKVYCSSVQDLGKQLQL